MNDVYRFQVLSESESTVTESDTGRCRTGDPFSLLAVRNTNRTGPHWGLEKTYQKKRNTQFTLIKHILGRVLGNGLLYRLDLEWAREKKYAKK